MKDTIITILLSTVIAFPAFSQENGSAPKNRSRTEVKKELAKSQHDGTYMKKNGEYPPSEQTITQQKADHAAAMHPKDGANPAFDTHDEPKAPR